MKSRNELGRSASLFSAELAAAVHKFVAKQQTTGTSGEIRCNRLHNALGALKGLKKSLESVETATGSDLSDAKGKLDHAMGPIESQIDAEC